MGIASIEAVLPVAYAFQRCLAPLTELGDEYSPMVPLQMFFTLDL